MLGSHLSIAGGLHNALLKAEEYGMECVQIFTANQQQWKAKPLTADRIEAWLSHARRLGFSHTVSHGSYLVNLASPDSALWRKSLKAFIDEFARCRELEIPFLVIHPGAHMGAGDDAGLTRIASALDRAFEVHPRGGVITCLEVTAGQGSSLGYRLEHIAAIIQRCSSPNRLGVCLDTAHLFAAGYDFRGRRYPAFLRELDRVLGIDRVQVIHLNDSKIDLGGRVDRHEHIGKGRIGLEGFRPFIRDRRFRQTPMILETPKEKAPDGRDWDEINLQVLRGLR